MRQHIGRALTISALLLAVDASAATKHYRLAWDGDASNSAVIGFSPDGSSSNPYVSYGYSTNENSWNSAFVSNSETFDGGITSHFVRLQNLNADSPIYFRVCDQSGCGERFWFKTAPAQNAPFVVVAGGDTRTGHTTRRKGNELLAKIRPLAVMHGGDFTNANSASEMRDFLDDWELTYSSDNIDGYNYKRIYPLIPTHGNHEDDNYSTICEVFGVDFNGDGNCTPSDTYGAVQITPLLRVYTLNSQFQNGGWSSYASAMNNWLSSDLSTYGSSANWRFAQYHKPMFPHYSGKSDNPTLFNWWAQPFYDYAMNLVVESDTHLTKMTEAVIPSGSNFSTTTNGGTVYVGEGSWGAPARSANDAKSWTIDMASIQQFKVIQVSEEGLVVRTAQFDGTAETLTWEERAADPLVLPDNVNWWSANRLGEAMNLVANSAGRSVIEEDTDNGGSFSLPVSDDVFISSRQSSRNFDGDSDGLLADGSDSTYGTLYTLIKFDLSNLSGCSSISSATLELNITNRSGNTFGIYQAANDWSEESATWNSVGGSSVRGNLAESFVPYYTGIETIDLLSSGLIDSWLSGTNTGLVIAALSGSNGVDFTSKETGMSPALKIEANCNSLTKLALPATGIDQRKGFIPRRLPAVLKPSILMPTLPNIMQLGGHQVEVPVKLIEESAKLNQNQGVTAHL
ncbi:DNRLRE domain-containing protein [Microbulbifer variabilis]|uniref:DNRLRE domain-containing protein n=1 Tax=Microbulbifer variabilis TaxID=266805 RepID=UPI001CFE3B2D|nr:DNRLRE domain-containing protein [Microbulbifer variabilis]